MEYRIFRDGSFDLTAGAVELISAYPRINGTAIRPYMVETSEDTILYSLPSGELRITFTPDADGISIGAVWNGDPVHDIMPVGAAIIRGCDRVFTQGPGMGGPSGFSRLGASDPDSDGIIAVGDEEHCAAIYAREHSRFRQRSGIRGEYLFAGFDTECIPERQIVLPKLFLRSGSRFSPLLRGCAKEIAETMQARPVDRQAFHWCSWYYLYHDLDQTTLESYLEGFVKYRPVAPFSHIQIDAGYFPSCGDWLDPFYRFPGGLKKAADSIRKAGYEPGIWIGPFMVGDNSRLYREHPDWILRYRDGSPVRPWIQYNEPKPWGYRDSDYFVLDTSCPEAMDYLRGVFRTLREWGYTLFKTDFLFWGWQDSAKVRRHTPGRTSVEYFRDVLKMIRGEIGEDARWLFCISPFMPAIGYADMIRIAGDVGAQWEEGGFGPTNMLRELTADQYFNGVYWQNDPDAIMLRDFHIHIKEEQIEALAILEAMSGGTMYTSDPIHLISRERRDLLSFIRPKEVHIAEYPEWSSLRDEVCVVQRLKTHTLVCFFNATDREITRTVDWAEILGSEDGYLFRRNGASRPVREVPCVTVRPRTAELFFATEEELSALPENMWEL